MTAHPERIISASYATEASWAVATDTWGVRLQMVGQPTISLTQERVAEPITQQYREEGKAGVLSVREGEFSIPLALTGHGGTTAGSLTATELATLLGNFFGGIDTDDIGDTVSVGTSATAFTAVPGGFNDGALIRVGSLSDGRCEGQWAAVNDGSAATTLLTALPSAPNVADVTYAAQNIWPAEAGTSTTLTSTRWLIATANNQYKLRGCYPKSVTIAGTGAGEQPLITLTYGVSWWDFASETFPVTTATDAKAGTICTNGSMFINDVGTTTRVTHSYRSWGLTINMETIPLDGPDAVNTYQKIVGASRSRCNAELTTMFDAEAAGTTTFADIFDAGTLQHILVGLSVADGKALAFYFPNCEMTTRPTQEASDGLNRVSCTWRALTGTTTTTERTMASWRMAMG